MEKIIVELNSKSIQETIKSLENIKKELRSLDVSISEELAKETLKQIENNYSQLPFESTNEEPSFRIDKSENKFKVIASSSGIIYEEFGTGDVGESKSHPKKSSYELRGYNTGHTIRDADGFSKAMAGITTGKYWTFNNERTGELEFTQGIPAGKFMFSSSEWLKSNYKDIVKKKVADALSQH